MSFVITNINPNRPCRASCSPKPTCDMKYCSFASTVLGISSFRTVSNAACNSSVVVALKCSGTFDWATALSMRFFSFPSRHIGQVSANKQVVEPTQSFPEFSIIPSFIVKICCICKKTADKGGTGDCQETERPAHCLPWTCCKRTQKTWSTCILCNLEANRADQIRRRYRA